MSLVLVGSTSGSVTLQEPAVAGTTTINLPASTGTMALLQTPSFATTIGVGGATPSASGAGITFPATQSASTDANTLDDYEEGTWTASISSQTNMTGATWTSGRYVKIGRLVTVQGLLSCTITSSNTLTYVTLTLPFIATDNETGVAFANNNVKVGVCDLTSGGGSGQIIPFFPVASAIVSGSELIQVAATYTTN
jgi:hypothetical protein